MNDSYASIKKKIIRKCLLMEKMGFFVGTWGNMSIRVQEGMIITPSKVQYDLLRIEDFLTVSLDGAIVGGHRLPSSETELHRALYNKRDDIAAIIHSHSPYATALSCLHKPIPPFVEDLVQIVGGQIECTTYVPAGQHKRLGEETAKAIGHVSAVLIGNHGVVCCGRNLDETFVTCQIVEKAAFMMLAAAAMGSVISIPEEYVRSERHRFLHKYGTKEDAS
jgi:L-fuculose-phosphate aldolase